MRFAGSTTGGNCSPHRVVIPVVLGRFPTPFSRDRALYYVSRNTQPVDSPRVLVKQLLWCQEDVVLEVGLVIIGNYQIGGGIIPSSIVGRSGYRSRNVIRAGNRFTIRPADYKVFPLVGWREYPRNYNIELVDVPGNTVLP